MLEILESVFVIAGIGLVAWRLLHPVYYYNLEGTPLRYLPPDKYPNAASYHPFIDISATILPCVAIALVTGGLVYLLRKL